MRLWRRLVVIIGKYGLGAAALGWVIWTADIDRTITTVSELSADSFFLIIIVSAACVVARVMTWHVLVSFFTDVDILRLLTADLIIKFVNSLFPSRFSGRSIAPVALRHFTKLTWSKSVAVTIAHTGLFAALYGFVTLFGVAIDVGIYGPGLTGIILLSASIYLAVGLAVVVAGWRLDLFDRSVSWLADSLNRLSGGERVAVPLDTFRTKLLEDSDNQFQRLVGDGRTVSLFVVTWAVAILALPTARLWLLFSATDVAGPDPLFLPLYLVVAYSVTVLPLTPGGIGVTEATAVAVFVALGFPGGGIVTVVFLDRLFGVYLPSLLGWVPLVRTNFSAAVK